MWTVSLLLALAFAASAELYKESSLRPNTEYVYKYESQVLSGIPASDNQYSGVRIVCDVKLQFTRDNLALLKFDNIRFCEINEHLKTMLPDELVPEVACLPASEHTHVIEKELVKPISFRWTAGLVSHLESEVSDPHWSVNVKRGVLNLLHLSLKQDTESRDTRSSELLGEYAAHNLLSKDGASDKAFLVREHDVMGKCESLYAIHGMGKGESFRVSKIKDYRNCYDKVIYEQGLFAGMSTWLMLSKEQRHDVIKPLTCTEYELTGDRNTFIIRSAKLRSKYIFTPFTTEGGSFVTYMRQHLDLQTTQSIRVPITISRSVSHASALQLHIPHSLATMSKDTFSDRHRVAAGRHMESGEYGTRTGVTGVTGNRMYTPRATHYKTRSEQTSYGTKYRGLSTSEETSEEISRMVAGTRESETSEESDELWGKSRGASYSPEESDEEVTLTGKYGQYKTTEDTNTYAHKARDQWTPEEEMVGELDEASAKISAIKGLLKEIVVSMHPFVTEETASKIILLSRRLQFLTSSELTTLMIHYGAFSHGVSEVRKIREILLDVLPTLPKAVVPKIIKTLAVKGFIYPKRAAYMISLFSLTAPPTPAVLHSLLSVCRVPEFTGLDVQVMRTCWLAAGTVTHKLYSMHIKARVSKAVSLPVIEHAIGDFRALLSSSHEDKRQLGIFAIGNSGLPDFIVDIKRIVSDRSLPVVVRQYAICALRRMSLLSPGQTLKVVLPVLMNTREPTPIRIGAFLIACYSNPHRITLELMLHRLRHDPSVELKSFAYSFISSVSKTTIPAYSELVSKLKHVLTLMKPFDFGLGHSKGFYMDHFNELTNFGIISDSYVMNTPASYLPSIISSRLGVMFAHQPIHLFESGVALKGLDEVLSNVVYAQSIWKKMLSGKFRLDDFLAPYEFSDFGTVRDSIKNILEKVKIEDRTFEKPEVLNWLGIVNNQVSYFTFDRNTIADLLSHHEMFSSLYSSSPVPFPVDIVKTLPLVDNCIILPTPIGLPITLNLTALAVAHVHGMVTPLNIPSLRDIFSRSTLPSELKVSLDLKSSLAVKTVVSFGVDMTVIKSAVSVKGHIISHLPLTCHLAVKPAEGHLKIMWDVPQTPFSPLKAAVTVVTVVKRLPVLSMPVVASWKNVKELPQMSTIRLTPFQMPAVFPAFGMRVDVTGQMAMRRASWAPFHPLACGHHFDVICRPTDERPKAVELKVAFDMSSVMPLMDLYESYKSGSGFSFGSGFGFDSSKTKETSFVDESVYASKKYDDYPSSSSSRSSFYGEDVEESDFSTVTPWSSISGARTSRLCVVLKTLGGTTDRRLKALVTWSRSSMYLVHHVNLQVTGSPLISYLDRPTKVMLDGVVDMSKLFSPAADGLIAKVTLGCGDSAYTTTDLSFKLMTGSTGYSWRSEYSPMYSYLTSDVSPSSGDMSEYYAVISYRNIPYHVMDAITTYYELVKVYTYPYMYVQKSVGVSGTQTPGQITVYAKCSFVHKKVTAVIRLPTESDVIIDLPTFNPFFSRQTLSISVPAPILMSRGVVDKFSSDVDYSSSSDWSSSDYGYDSRSSNWWKSWTGECKLSDNTLHTFDGVSYKLPAGTSDACDVIVARDCSHRGLFTVISSPLTYKVKVILPHYEISVHVEPSTYAYDVKINGIAKVISSSSRTIVLSEHPTESSDDAYEITKEGEVVKIYCVKTGVTIKVGSYVSVKVSSAFRGRLCGLCGNFNGEHYDEYEGPSKAIYDRPEHSSLKYYVSSELCPVGDYYRKYGVPDVTYTDECTTNLRNIAKATFLRGERQVCFTVEPQRVCSPACRKVGVTRKIVAFHCLPAADATTDSLLRDSRRRPLSEFYGKTVDLRDYVDTQERCVAPSA